MKFNITGLHPTEIKTGIIDILKYFSTKDFPFYFFGLKKINSSSIIEYFLGQDHSNQNYISTCRLNPLSIYEGDYETISETVMSNLGVH